MRSSLTAVVSCLALTGYPLAAGAAGLGRVVVFSALGQPLRAEIEVSATREELSGMKAQLASQETFKQSGVEYSTTLLGIRFALDKRANGQPVIKLSSESPINDPFVDMLLELNWPAGRLVREYTFLLDPPEMASKAPAPVASAVSRAPAATSQPTATGTATGAANPAIDDEVRSKAVASVRGQAAAPAADAQKRPAAAAATGQSAARSPSPGADARDSYEVKRGETLSKIASQTKPEGVSLEQMLVGLLRANQDAFDGGNMNRLKAGKILSVPDKAAIEAVAPSEAKKVVIAQSSDWNAYRSKLASAAAQAPVQEGQATQQATGKITPKVEDRATSAVEPKDQLKVSKTEAGAGAAGAAAKRSEDDRVAREKALKEANERQLALEKNVAELQKLVELKNQNLAELQKQAAAKPAPIETKPAVPPVAAVVAPATPVASTSPASATPAPAAATPTAAAVTPPAASEAPVVAPVVTPAPVAVAAPPPAPVVAAPPPAAKPKPVAPVPEPSLVDELLSYPLALAGGALALLLAAWLIIRRRRSSGDSETPLDLSSNLSLQGSSLTANSVFRSTGGQSVDTSHTPAHTDFSQAGPGSIDTDEVDPVAEADVYMAYGRDAQAEEILLEAKQKDPKRHAIHLKLLEIYANRKNVKQFETLAADLYSETGGSGADWEKAAAMGAKLGPANPLFSASAPASDVEPLPSSPSPVAAPSIKPMAPLAGAAVAAAALAATPEPVVPASPVVAERAPLADLTSLDFDLGLGDAASAPSQRTPAGEDRFAMPETAVNSAPLDFDLVSTSSNSFTATDGVAQATMVGYDFNLADPAPAAVASDPAESAVADFDFDVAVAAADDVPSLASGDAKSFEDTVLRDDDGLKFDARMTDSTFLGSSMPEVSSFDMSSIDLDLKMPELETAEAEAALADSNADSVEFERVQVATAVNPDFAMMQTETLINPQVGAGHADDRDHDFLTAQAETLINQPFGETRGPETQFDISPNEEVATKLDLAKAYEEMADFEGARELLHEVMKEGDAAQKDAAQAILAKIGD